MTEREARAQRLYELKQHYGWIDAVAIGASYVRENRDALEEMMISKPDSLTGKTAIAKANRARGVEDFFKSIDEEIKILTPTRRGGS